MPRKYGYKKRKPRRRRRKRKYRISAPMGRMQSGFPSTRVCKFRYVEQIALNAGIGTIASVDFKANGCHDPYTPSGGHQPLGWDEWKSFYNRYIVLGSKINVAFSQSTAGANTAPVACGVFVSDDGTIPTSVTTIAEQGLSKWKYLSAPAGTGSNAIAKVSQTFSSKKFFNVADLKDNYDRYGANVEADPTDQAHFMVWCGDIAPSGDPAGINAFVVVDYIVMFSEPKALVQS